MKPEVKYGLIYGAVSILISLLMYVTGLNRSDSSWIPNLLSMIIPIACTVLVVNETKALNAGYISFGTAFKKCLAVVSIGSLISAVYVVLYTSVIDTEFMEYQMQKQVEKMQEIGMNESDIEEAINRNAQFQTPMWMFIFTLLMFMFIGAVISLIVAAIKKNPNPEEIA
jgi:flagellar biosynthesis protein FliQ